MIGGRGAGSHLSRIRGRGGLPDDTKSRSQFLYSFASTVALTALVVAVPVALWSAAGSPFGDWGIPAGRNLVASAGVDPRSVAHWLARSALLLAWIAWLWMTLCVLIEITTLITGRPRARLPGSRTMQSIAACLVGTALAVATVGRPAAGTEPTHRPVVTEPMTSIPVISDLDDYWQTVATGAEPNGPRLPSGIRIGLTTEGTLAEPVARATSVPSPGDSGRGIASAEGFKETPSPATRSEQAPGPESRAAPEVRRHVVTARETLWSIAHDELGTASRWREIADLNYGLRQADGHCLDWRHWMAPGWQLLLPDDVHPGDSHNGVPTRGPTFGLVPVAGAADDPARSSHRLRPSESVGPAAPAVPSVPLVPIGAGVVGEGVASLIDRMRRVQQRYRRPGEFIRLPVETTVIERRIRLGDDHQIARDVDSAVRLMVRTHSADPAAVPTVIGARVDDEQVEILLAGSDRLGVGQSNGPSRKDAGGDGEFVVLREHLQSDGPESIVAAPVPLLVSAGRNHDDLLMMANLEPLGSLAIDGDPRAAEDFVRALSLELATSYWAGQFDTVLVGFGTEFERFPRTTSLPNADQIVGDLESRARRGRDTLQRAGFHTYAEARCCGRDGPWEPVVVICGPGIPRHAIIDVVEIAADPACGSVVVAVGPVATVVHTLRITADRSRTSMRLLGSVVEPQLIDSTELQEVGTLIDTASNRQSVARAIAPYDLLTIRLPEPEPESNQNEGAGGTGVGNLDPPPVNRPASLSPGRVSSRSVPLAFVAPAEVADRGHGPETGDAVEVEVAVLGPIEVRGALRSFTRAWAQELVVYLAMHPKGVTNEAWTTALWPERLMAPSSLHSTASVARRALGQNRDGQDHLPRAHGRLCLAATVGTDWDRFVALCEADSPKSWRAALELVRGRPFEGLRASDWPVLEGIAPAIEATVVDVSGRMAGASLRSGDPGGAEWAARKGLLVSPYDERLYRMLMRTADAAGNPAGVEAALEELVRLVADDIEPLDSVHPSTLELYQSLSRRRHRGDHALSSRRSRT
jgi:DNA-binding SARP family transcriptional activator